LNLLWGCLNETHSWIVLGKGAEAITTVPMDIQGRYPTDTSAMNPLCKNSLGCCWNHCHTLDIIQSKSIPLWQFLARDNMATHANTFHLNHPHTFEMADKSEKHSRCAVGFNSSES
jgi:hypothetical protein